MSDYNIEGYQALAAGVVEQAVSDYRKALRRLHKHPFDAAAIRTKEECERFFKREMGKYSDLDGQAIIREVQRRVNKEMGK